MHRQLFAAALIATLSVSALAAGQLPAATEKPHPSSSAHANGVAGQANATRLEACDDLSASMLDALGKGDFETARREQLASVELIRILGRFGYMAAAKATMGFLGVDVGGPRLPNTSLKSEQANELRSELQRWGFFERVANHS